MAMQTDNTTDISVPKICMQFVKLFFIALKSEILVCNKCLQNRRGMSFLYNHKFQTLHAVIFVSVLQEINITRKKCILTLFGIMI
jgi:hypothetical protein